MKCRECGTILSENEKFCPDCGTAAAAILTISCPCGVTLRGEHKFCYNCGAPVQLKRLPESTPKLCSAKLPDGTPCGFTLLQGLNFCPNCGTRSSAQEGQQTQGSGKGGAQQNGGLSNTTAVTASLLDSNQPSGASDITEIPAALGDDTGW